jgi:hypothetical protein
MGEFYRILTAAMLAVHLMVGCCSHHAHACDNKDRPSLAHSDASHDGDQCPESGDDYSHHGPQNCQGERCSYLAPTVSPNQTVSDSLTLSFQTVFMALPDDQLPLVGFGPEQQLSLAAGRLLLPVRLHLANQVLLI